MTLADLLPVITALAGALVGGAVSGLGALLADVRLRRRVLRSILFELLELRYQVGRRDPERMVAALSELLAEWVGKDAAATFASTPAGQQTLRQIVAATAKALSEKPLGPGYDGAIRDLAPHDSFLAYQLRGQDRVLQIDQAVASYFSDVLALPSIALDPATAGIRGAAEPATAAVMREGAREQLGRGIRRVALALSPIAYVKARLAILKQDTPDRSEMRRWIDQWVARLPPGTLPPRAG